MVTTPAPEPGDKSVKTVRSPAPHWRGTATVLGLLWLTSLTARTHAENKIPVTEKDDRLHLEQRVREAEQALNHEPNSAGKQLAVAKLLYFQAVAGESKAAQRSEAMLSKLRDADPQDAVVQAYLGSLQLLRGARTLAVWDKMPLINQGLAAMDQAVTRAPDNLEVRFIRAVSTHHLPFFFERAQQSADDFAFLAPRVAEAVKAGQLEDTLGTASLYHHGQHKLEANDRAAAIEAFKTAVEIGPVTPAGRDAASQLKKLSGNKNSGK